MQPDPLATIKKSPAIRQWNDIGIRPHYGIAVPLFSLHSKSSCGIGEFTDLIPLFPWCRSIGVELIQLLPLNDTGDDTSPYSALTAFALNPIHLGLQHLKHIELNAALQEQLVCLQHLTICQRVCYKEVFKGKMEFLHEYYRLCRVEDKIPLGYMTFKENNKHWCISYGLFKALKLQTGWENWEEWTTPYDHPSTIELAMLPEEIQQEVEFHIFVQYLCFEQFLEVKNTATVHGIKLKGDIPILINRQSADVWQHTNLFDLNYAAGAPPDMYAEEGQKWGFPLYNWDALAAQGYRWWVDRLNFAAQFYDIYRIDHIVGFYRIWGIPIDLPATQGQFIPPERSTWIPHGETILQVMLKECNMLPIGEDLGTIPPEVRVSLKSLGICGTKVMRWERRWNEDSGYILPSDYPIESMTTVSTHDSETLAQWWTNNPEEAKPFAEMLGLEYDIELTRANRMAVLKASNQSASLFHINLLNEYLALIPEMVWSNPEDERINVPGTVNETNWTYRFCPSVEEIVACEPLTDMLKQIFP